MENTINETYEYVLCTLDIISRTLYNLCFWKLKVLIIFSRYLGYLL